jgi:hypothetical protein
MHTISLPADFSANGSESLKSLEGYLLLIALQSKELQVAVEPTWHIYRLVSFSM